MGHELIFIMQGGGTWKVLLMFDHGENMVQFDTSPKFRLGMSVWS
jgi:hypothetical protein